MPALRLAAEALHKAPLTCALPRQALAPAPLRAHLRQVPHQAPGLQGPFLQRWAPVLHLLRAHARRAGQCAPVLRSLLLPQRAPMVRLLWVPSAHLQAQRQLLRMLPRPWTRRALHARCCRLARSAGRNADAMAPMRLLARMSSALMLSSA